MLWFQFSMFQQNEFERLVIDEKCVSGSFTSGRYRHDPRIDCRHLVTFDVKYDEDAQENKRRQTQTRWMSCFDIAAILNFSFAKRLCNCSGLDVQKNCFRQRQNGQPCPNESKSISRIERHCMERHDIRSWDVSFWDVFVPDPNALKQDDDLSFYRANKQIKQTDL